MPLLKLEGQVYLATAQVVDVTETPATVPATIQVTIPAGYYYPNSVMGANAALLGLIASSLTGHTTLVGTYTCSVDDDTDAATGKVTIGVTGITSVQIAWTNATALRDLLGYTGTITVTPASPQTAPNHMTHLFLPTCAMSEVLATPPTSSSQRLGRPEYDATSRHSPSGHNVNIANSKRYKENLVLPHLEGRKVWKNAELTTNESLEKFWEEVVGKGRPFRIHLDRSNDSDKWAMYIEDFAEINAEKVQDGWHGSRSQWRVRHRMRESRTG